MLIGLLKSAGFNGGTVAELREARSIARSFRPDFVVIDLNPELPDYYKRNLSIASDRLFNSTPAIFLLSEQLPFGLDNPSVKAFRDYFKKPIDNYKLLQIIKRAASGRKQVNKKQFVH